MKVGIGVRVRPMGDEKVSRTDTRWLERCSGMALGGGKTHPYGLVMNVGRVVVAGRWVVVFPIRQQAAESRSPTAFRIGVFSEWRPRQLYCIQLSK